MGKTTGHQVDRFKHLKRSYLLHHLQDDPDYNSIIMDYHVSMIIRLKSSPDFCQNLDTTRSRLAGYIG